MPITADVHQSPRRRTADATRRQMVARYHRSNLTQRAFCLQAGIPFSTLQWWLTQARRGVFHASEIARSLGVADITAARYLDVLAGAFMVRRLPPRFENNGGRQMFISGVSTAKPDLTC